MTVPPADTLDRRAGVRQEWMVDDEIRPYIESFMLVAYATKQISNCRGDGALRVFFAITGQGGAINYRPAESIEDAAGLYAAPVWWRNGRG